MTLFREQPKLLTACIPPKDGVEYYIYPLALAVAIHRNELADFFLSHDCVKNHPHSLKDAMQSAIFYENTEYLANFFQREDLTQEQRGELKVWVPFQDALRLKKVKIVLYCLSLNQEGYPKYQELYEQPDTLRRKIGYFIFQNYSTDSFSTWKVAIALKKAGFDFNIFNRDIMENLKKVCSRRYPYEDEDRDAAESLREYLSTRSLAMR